MAPRALKLGTRRSTLARAQSAAVARQLEQLHPGLQVELIGIETRGDRILDKPLSSVDGKEFFTAEIDAALLAGAVDFTVHSYKDLSLVRPAQLLLVAAPRREQPRDIALFAPDVLAQLAAGQPLRVGTSSPRRASFMPDFLQRVLPRMAAAQAEPVVRQVELRGNVDSRLRRLHEPRGSARHLDGVVLAFAGLSRLWADAAGEPLLRELLAPLRYMVLPLSACPAAPAQGALAVECRADDTDTVALLRMLDDAPTRAAVAIERALLAERGGGCHQRFGATQIALPGLGTLLHVRAARIIEAGFELEASQLHWTPPLPLAPPPPSVIAWDGTRVPRAPAEPIAEAAAQARTRLQLPGALFVTHRRALPDGELPAINPAAHLFVPGLDTWQALAERGVWVDACAEGLGFEALAPLLAEPLLQLPALQDWTVLTHADAAVQWPWADVIATYRHESGDAAQADVGAPRADCTHLYWHSGAQFERWHARVAADVSHACGPGKTYEHLRSAGAHNVQMFPQVAHWRQWLGL